MMAVTEIGHSGVNVRRTDPEVGYPGAEMAATEAATHMAAANSADPAAHVTATEAATHMAAATTATGVGGIDVQAAAQGSDR
jgi:hypothetical protein